MQLFEVPRCWPRMPLKVYIWLQILQALCYIFFGPVRIEGQRCAATVLGGVEGIAKCLPLVIAVYFLLVVEYGFESIRINIALGVHTQNFDL